MSNRRHIVMQVPVKQSLSLNWKQAESLFHK